MEIALRTLCQSLDALLEVSSFQDYCPNGLQVEGRAQVRRVVTGVTASRALLEEAVAWNADAILVHHGYFWKGEPAPLIGMKGDRVRLLMQSGISLLAYHLPLDAHVELGNNAQLAQLMGWRIEGGMQNDPRPIGNHGRLVQPCSGVDLQVQLEARLGRSVVHVAGPQERIERIAWCTGGAQNMIEQAVALGVDAYITGEISEPTVHVAREAGIHFYAAGHHATERYGIQALGRWLVQQHGVEWRHIDIDSPA